MSAQENEPAEGDPTEHADTQETDAEDEPTPVESADDAGTADAVDDTDAEDTDTEDTDTEDTDTEDTDTEDTDTEDTDGADDPGDGDEVEDADDQDTGAAEDSDDSEDSDEVPDSEDDAEQQPGDADPGRRPGGAHARRVTPRQRLRALVTPRANKTQALIALACLVLGFGLSVQAQSTSSASSFSSLRQSELVSVLDRLTNRQDHLRGEITRLQQEKAALSSENGDVARKAAQDRQDTLGILAGTEPATGPGIELNVTDPHGAINAADLLNAVEELRDSGAEVMQIGSVRIGADTYFLDTQGGVVVDGHRLTPPYRVLAIGDPHTMSTAMNIPGGVLESLHRSGAEGAVTESQSLSITAIRKP